MIAEGVFTLAGDHDGAAHVAIHRHAAPTVPVVGGVTPAVPVALDAPRPG